MNIKAKRGITFVFMIVLIAMLSTSVSTVKAASSPAHAAVTTWYVSDSFEGATIWNRWSCWQTIANAENFCDAGTRARTGAQSGYVSVLSGWSDIRTWESLDPFKAGRTLSCFAQIYISFSSVVWPNGLTAQLEVIDADTSQYIAVKQFNSTDHYGWQLIKTANWTPTHKNILVRLGLIGADWTSQDAYLDDYKVQCQY